MSYILQLGDTGGKAAAIRRAISCGFLHQTGKQISR